MHAWLMRRGLEALDMAAGAERVKHAGVKWVFDHGELYATLLSVMPDGRGPDVEETEQD